MIWFSKLAKQCHIVWLTSIMNSNTMAERSTTARCLSWFSLLLMACLGLIRAGYFNHDVHLTGNVWIEINRRSVELCISTPNYKAQTSSNDPPLPMVDRMKSIGKNPRRDLCKMSTTAIRPVSRYGFSLWWGVAFAASIIVWVFSLKRKSDAGCCIRCNYSLTGNQTGICPECGLVVEATPPAINS